MFILSKVQKHMLLFLTNASEKNPKNLHTKFRLKDRARRQSYADYLDLIKMGLINENRKGDWLTNTGKKQLEKT
jgi:hypothetical protein